jgi:hypothetical protein
MLRNRSLFSLVAVLGLTACSPADYKLDDKPDSGGILPQQCPEGQLECTGNPDSPAMTCRCRAVFECPTPEKCDRDRPVPPGGGSWTCTWQEFKYTCTSTDVQEVPGGAGWSCFKSEQGVTCTTTPIVPGNGSWICKVVGSTLTCEKKPTGTGGYTCTADGKLCTKGDLPPGGGNWKCHQSTQGGAPSWICVGDSTTPPGGGGWTCVKLDEFNQWRCERPGEDHPPGGGNYQCVKGSEFGGTKCELVPTTTDKDACKIGEVMWCDGLQYCGWGQVSCDPATGKWKTTVSSSGKVVLDCQELANGARPNTVCACYHFYFNPVCCERADCVVPSGTKPQVCAPSAGGLCDYCNPHKPECKGTGAKCIVSNAHETFCGELCGAQKPCPAGYQCMVVKPVGGQSTNQCVPADFSCYF